MKILHVDPFFSPVHGGSAVAAYYLSKKLAESGHDVTFFTSNSQISQDWIDGSPQIKLHPFKTWLRARTLYVTPGIIRAAREMVKSFDIIHMHNFRTYHNVVVAYYAKKYGVPYILQGHGSLPRQVSLRNVKWFYDVAFGYDLLRRASSVVALTPTESRQYEEMGFPKEKIKIIPNGIDLSEYRELPQTGCFRSNFSINNDEKIILFIGRIHAIKGLYILVKAFADLRAKAVKLVIIGPDDGYLGNLRSLITHLKIDNKVLVLPAMYGKDKLAAYVDSDVVVLPSYYETFPMVILEAFACAKGVVASNVESIHQIVRHGKTGLLFQSGNPQELRRCLLYLLGHPQEAKAMGLKAYNVVTHEFSTDTVASAFISLYESLSHKHDNIGTSIGS